MKYILPIKYESLDWRNKPLDGHPSKEVRGKIINTSLFPRGFFKNPIHLQHCHKTGMTEGAVHSLCNAVMWQYHNR
jgi:hypothetical protein